MWEIFDGFDRPLSKAEQDKLERYYQLLTEWNQKTNLTAITEYDEVIVKHFADSATLDFHPDETHEFIKSDHELSEEEIEKIPSEIDPYLECINCNNTSLIDIGTGAGFPGIVLAILKPEWEITLLESVKKKTVFLEEMVRELSLDHVQIINERAEILAHDSAFRGRFDIATTRAVAELRIIMELGVPFINENGYMIAYKGPNYQEEMDAAYPAMKKLNCDVTLVNCFDLNGMKRTHVICKRTGEVPEQYPRRPGIPAKRPL